MGQVEGFHVFPLFLGCKCQMEVRKAAEYHCGGWGWDKESTSADLMALPHLSFEVSCHTFPCHTAPLVHRESLLEELNALKITWMGFSYVPSGPDSACLPTNDRKLHRELLVFVSKLHHALC